MNETFSVERLNSADELLDALSRRNSRWGIAPGEWVFRGQADSEWHLVPSAFRDGIRFCYGPERYYRRKKTHGSQLMAEADLIRSFVIGMDRQGLPLPSEAAFRWMDYQSLLDDLFQAPERADWPPDEFAPLFALAQHHGIPTRLLDWSERPFVAAYFAAVGAAGLDEDLSGDRFFAVWALHPRAAHPVLNESAFQKQPPALRAVRAPQASNPNLRAQGGIFTVLVDNTRRQSDSSSFPPLDELMLSRLRQRERLGGKPLPPAIRKFEVPYSEARRLLRLLSDEWVNGTHLYPGVDGVVRGLKEHAISFPIPISADDDLDEP